MNRGELIERKQQVIAQIQQARREWEAIRLKNDRGSRRRTRALEDQLERLMAEESMLRIAIDRARD